MVVYLKDGVEETRAQVVELEQRVGVLTRSCRRAVLAQL